MMRRTPNRWLLGATLAAGTIAAGVVLLAPGSEVSAQDTNSTDSTAATSTVATSSVSTSEVRRETLRTSDEFNGDLGFGEQRELVSPADGVITGLPADESIVELGDVIWEIDRQPVPYLEGEIPMYRELYWGATKGDDVLQLETMLIGAGHGPAGWVADTSFNRTTRNALKQFQKANGMTDDGSIGPSEVMFGVVPLRVADTAYVGDATTNGPLLTVTEATAEVSVATTSRQLPTFQDSSDVVVVLADGTELAASIDEIKATPADEQGRFGYQVTYAVADVVGQGQPVKIRIEQTLADDALTVPVDALIALAEGGYAVEVVTPSGNVLRAVEVIDFDDTRVAFTGDLAEGDLVVVP